MALSPVPDLSLPWAAASAAWRDHVAARLVPGRPVFVATLFRHVDTGAPPGTLHRIRQLNLLAAELSQALGTYVIDLDAALAHAGGLALGADTRLQSPAAIQLAAETIAGALLSSGLDHVLDGAALVSAQAALPALRQPAPAVHTAPALQRLGPARYVGRGEGLGERGLKDTVRDLAARRIGLAEAVPVIARRLRARVTR